MIRSDTHAPQRESLHLAGGTCTKAVLQSGVYDKQIYSQTEDEMPVHYLDGRTARRWRCGPDGASDAAGKAGKHCSRRRPTRRCSDIQKQCLFFFVRKRKKYYKVISQNIDRFYQLLIHQQIEWIEILFLQIKHCVCSLMKENRGKRWRSFNWFNSRSWQYFQLSAQLANLDLLGFSPTLLESSEAWAQYSKLPRLAKWEALFSCAVFDPILLSSQHSAEWWWMI